MYKKLMALLCLVFILMFDWVAQGKPDLHIEVEPSRFELRLSPAEAASGTILLKNKSGKRMLISTAVNDWDMSINGFSAFFNPASRKDSCAGWITLNPSKFMIENAKQQTVKFTLTPPPGVEIHEYRCAVFFNGQAATPDKNDPVVPGGKIAAVAALYCDFPGVQREGRVLKTESHYNAKQRTVESLLEVESTGTAHIRFQGLFDIREEGGKMVGSGEYDGNVVFPGKKMLLKGMCQRKLAPGKYIVKSVLKYQQPSYGVGDKGWEEYSGGLRQIEAAAEFSVNEGN